MYCKIYYLSPLPSSSNAINIKIFNKIVKIKATSLHKSTKFAKIATNLFLSKNELNLSSCLQTSIIFKDSSTKPYIFVFILSLLTLLLNDNFVSSGKK